MQHTRRNYGLLTAMIHRINAMGAENSVEQGDEPAVADPTLSRRSP